MGGAEAEGGGTPPEDKSPAGVTHALEYLLLGASERRYLLHVWVYTALHIWGDDDVRDMSPGHCFVVQSDRRHPLETYTIHITL